jgi:hypothetical protein
MAVAETMRAARAPCPARSFSPRRATRYPQVFRNRHKHQATGTKPLRGLEAAGLSHRKGFGQGREAMRASTSQRSLADPGAGVVGGAVAGAFSHLSGQTDTAPALGNSVPIRLQPDRLQESE